MKRVESINDILYCSPSCQHGYDWLIGYPETIEANHESRVKDVRDFYNGSVAEWAKKYEY